MKIFLFIIVFFISITSFSQEIVYELKLNLTENTDVFQVVEEDKKQVTLFFSDKNKVKAVRLNESFQVIDSLSTASPSKDFRSIVGYSLTSNKYYSYWSSAKKKEIIYQCFDFETKQITSKSFKIEFEKEKIIEIITVNNIFYLVTCVKNSSILNFYVFKDGNLDKKSIDLTDKKFLSSETKPKVLWDIFDESTAFESSFFVQDISNESPPSLTLSANKRKVYSQGNSLIFSLDLNSKFTQLLNINLNNFSADLKSYNQPFIEENSYMVAESNSFLSNDKLIQMKLTWEKMIISIKNLDGTEFKKFEVLTDQEISFKNSDIIQENGSIKNTRILDNSSKLLRKIQGQNSSLSCYTSKGKNYVTIGSVSLIQQNGVLLGGMLGGFTGAMIASSISYNNIFNNLNSYSGRKVVFINCLFDENFNHLEGNVDKLAFDKLRFFAENGNKLTSPTIFKMNSSLVFAAYNKKLANYFFYKFID